MRGSIVKRGKGYAVVVELGRDPVTGRRQQKWHSGLRTKRMAEDALAEMVHGVKSGTYVTKTRQTLAEYVTEWLAAIEPTVRPSTHYSYARNLRLHVLPYLGGTSLHAVDAGMLNGLYARLLADGRRDTKAGGLSPAIGALRAHDRAPGVQGCGQVGPLGSQSCRRCRPATGQLVGEP